MADQMQAHEAGRANLGRNGDHRIAAVRLVIGLIQGLSLYVLLRTTEGGDASWSSRHPGVFAPLLLIALFLPPLMLAGAGRIRWLTLGVWAVVATAALAFLGWYDIHRQAASQGLEPTPVLFAFSAVALFISHHLIAPADRERRLFAPYPSYFDAAWMAGVQLVLSIAFAGAFWVLLLLGAGLFNIIGLKFLSDLIGKPWFALPLTGLAFATAVHLTDVRDGLIRGVRTIALMLLSWLLLVLTVLVGGFLLALPFTGLDGLWKTGHATAMVLAAAGGLIVLINAAYQDGKADNLPPVVLRIAVQVAAVLLWPLIAIAVWGLSLRIGQHGLTPDRIIASACALVGAAYALGYGLGAVVPLARKGSPWMKALEATNVAVGLLIVAVIMALLSPLADPARLSVADQVRRLETGRVAINRFDWRFLRFQSGKAGEAALARLTQSSNVAIAGWARAESARRFDGLGNERQFRNLDIVVDPINGQTPLPKDFLTKQNGDYPECYEPRFCVGLQRDIDGDSNAEIIVAYRSGVSVFSKRDGRWVKIGDYRAGPCDTEQGLSEVLRSGRFEFLPPEISDLQIGGHRLTFAPTRACSGSQEEEVVTVGAFAH
jgi:hypothetical protein